MGFDDFLRPVGGDAGFTGKVSRKKLQGQSIGGASTQIVVGGELLSDSAEFFGGDEGRSGWATGKRSGKGYESLVALRLFGEHFCASRRSFDESIQLRIHSLKRKRQFAGDGEHTRENGGKQASNAVCRKDQLSVGVWFFKRLEKRIGGGTIHAVRVLNQCNLMVGRERWSAEVIAEWNRIFSFRRVAPRDCRIPDDPTGTLGLDMKEVGTRTALEGLTGSTGPIGSVFARALAEPGLGEGSGQFVFSRTWDAVKKDRVGADLSSAELEHQPFGGIEADQGIELRSGGTAQRL